MPKDSSCLTDSSVSISVRDMPVCSERPGLGVGKRPNRWPFTVEGNSSAIQSPVADRLPLARKESSHFIT
ncbi:hypothetical protein [Polaromonas glacialis]|uniref:hypothetical protein n=1 Tax=Polaromonas glacialis TaxID=866564 RepID=UPI000AF2E1DD|nr:hypothetical protein [Polaromonas glacialis]